jgi:ABC-type lipoprotein release transport system permease subunit
LLGKTILLGLLGAVVGCLLGTLVVMLWRETLTVEIVGPPVGGPGLLDIVDPRLWLTVGVVTPFLTALASWLPALIAARRDPAVVLSEGQ